MLSSAYDMKRKTEEGSLKNTRNKWKCEIMNRNLIQPQPILYVGQLPGTMSAPRGSSSKVDKCYGPRILMIDNDRSGSGCEDANWTKKENVPA